MTKTEADAVLKMTAAELINFDLVDSALLPNLQTQRDSAIAQAATYESEKSQITADHAAALKKAQEDAAEALTAAVTPLQDQVAEKEAALAAKKQQLAEVAAAHDAILTKLQAVESTDEFKEKKLAEAVQAKQAAADAATAAQAVIDALTKS